MPHLHSPPAPPIATSLMVAGLAAVCLAGPAGAQDAPRPQQAALAPYGADLSTPEGAGLPTAGSVEVVPLRSLLSRAVVDPSDSVIAVVQDFVLDPATGRVHAVLAVAGRGRLVAVPTPALRVRDDGSLLVNADRAALMAMPAIDAPALAEAGGPSAEGLLAPTLPAAPRPLPLAPVQ